MTFEARNVVLATGAYPKPKLPTASAALSMDICQLHTSEYRNPQTLPSGAVLVVGSWPVGLPDRRGTSPERTAGLLVYFKLWKSSATLPRQGRRLVAH